ncbi:hypothetical protein F0227_15780 [Vibrio sp. 99-8-1]|nr:hypothetical protein [Vibrio sp. 99-8-1]
MYHDQVLPVLKYKGFGRSVNITLGLPYVLKTLERATYGCMDGEFDAVVTGPVHKGIINRAGVAFSGHTEFFAEKSNTPLVVMMLATEGLRVALVTTHLPLNYISKAVTAERLESIIRILHSDLVTKFAIKQPKIFVCGLNPQQADTVLGMYHDQVLPVLKYKGFGRSVNITLGLPFIRTSVDHGTALDLAATGQADTGSFQTALQYAIELVEKKK